MCVLIPTVFLFKTHFGLVLLVAVQGFVYLLHHAVAGLGSLEEAAGARFLHHLGADEAGQITKAIRAVHNGVTMTTLGIPQ